MEESWALRIALLGIGILILGGVYILGVIRRRGRAHRYRRDAPAWSSSRYSGADEFEAETRERDPVDDEIIAVRVRKIE
ncbi:MAG: hypothetical protein ACREXT_02885, partial [Gammaproteobacteria bacterium]